MNTQLSLQLKGIEVVLMYFFSCCFLSFGGLIHLATYVHRVAVIFLVSDAAKGADPIRIVKGADMYGRLCGVHNGLIPYHLLICCRC